MVECETWLDFDVWHQRWLSDLKGNPLPFQQVQPEAMQLVPRIIFPAVIGAEQAAQFLVRSDPPPKDFLISTDLQASPRPSGEQTY